VDPSAEESVHLSAWPEYDPAVINDQLNREMALVMRLASLGHAARNKANRKVRQPLAEVAFAVSNRDEAKVVIDHTDLLEDELNVKQVRLLNAAGEAVSFALNPLPKQLGQKYGNLYPELRKAILALDVDKTATTLLAGQTAHVKAAGKDYEILPEEIEVRMQAKSGYSVAAEGAYLAALETELTPALIQEGLAREFVRRVQDLRKSADLEIADRIQVYYTATPGLLEAVNAFKEYVMGETLAIELIPGTNPEGLPSVEDEFDKEKVTVSLKKA
jgi:isoleucyl-tRNA synthetase